MTLLVAAGYCSITSAWVSLALLTLECLFQMTVSHLVRHVQLKPGVGSPSGISTLPSAVPRQQGWVGTLAPLCIAICIQLSLLLLPSLYNKQSAGQIKIMAITDSGLHILSAAKVRAKSMNASVEAGGGCMKRGLLPRPSPGSLRIYQALISGVLV